MYRFLPSLSASLQSARRPCHLCPRNNDNINENKTQQKKKSKKRKCLLSFFSFLFFSFLSFSLSFFFLFHISDLKYMFFSLSLIWWLNLRSTSFVLGSPWAHCPNVSRIPFHVRVLSILKCANVTDSII